MLYLDAISDEWKLNYVYTNTRFTEKKTNLQRSHPSTSIAHTQIDWSGAVYLTLHHYESNEMRCTEQWTAFVTSHDSIAPQFNTAVFFSIYFFVVAVVFSDRIERKPRSNESFTPLYISLLLLLFSLSLFWIVRVYCVCLFIIVAISSRFICY